MRPDKVTLLALQVGTGGTAGGLAVDGAAGKEAVPLQAAPVVATIRRRIPERVLFVTVFRS
jgi:hypothetical protein